MASSTATVGHMATQAFLKRDPRTIDWSLCGNKKFIITLSVAYVFIVKFGGPRFMKGRKPFDGIKPLIIVYNAAMVFLNCYFMVAILSKSYLGGGYNLFCQGIDFEARDEVTMSLLTLFWWYLMVRIADFLDTFFFVLRKKDSHISFLHVVHHTMVVFNGWFGLTYGGDGQVTLGVILNCFVHVVMHSYYFLSLLGPSVQKHLWWKRYLTQFQLAHIAIIFVHNCLPFFITCRYPRALSYIILAEAVFFLGMYVRFYIKTYSNKKTFSSVKGEVKQVVKNKAN